MNKFEKFHMLKINIKGISGSFYRIVTIRFIVTGILFFSLFQYTYNQTIPEKPADQIIYVDQKGIMRDKVTNEEVSFFGVNYTVPFAFAYRALNSMGVNHEKAISEDVYHMARLGIDAFRVHVWDIEISDSLGNLLENEHLRLYDFLLSKLKERNIKILLTPIAYWGNGYPEKDTKTSGFSAIYYKDVAAKDPKAIEAQANYLKQILNHVNPYTKLSYADDPDIIALEICNEPSHIGNPALITEFINKMADACRSAKWKKPVFYNVSQNAPEFADAVLNANIDGCTFQWYPAGLVRGHELLGNFLPYVDKYTIPFKDNPQFVNKAKAVYEFETADISKSYIYPAVAKSFREAGFQWATQFAYDPMALAYCNAEYPTHYLNLAYTPSKAISLLIASKVFHRVPRLKDFGTYPNDSVFDVFRVSYSESLSEMNSDSEYYYTNSTKTKPLDTKKLKHIAGCGSSPIITYSGSGAYFMDKLEDGIWRLEVMPDAIRILDPFDKPSFGKEVTRIQWQNQSMIVQIPDLGENFTIKGINQGNICSVTSHNYELQIDPGVYLLIRKGKNNKNWGPQSKFENFQLGEFVAPKPAFSDPFIVNNSYKEVSTGKVLKIEIKALGIDTSDHLLLTIFGYHHPIEFIRKSGNELEAEVPAELIKPGIISYVIVVQKGDKSITFPGNHPGSIYDWNYYYKDCWTIKVVDPGTPIAIFDVSTDKDNIEYSFNTWWQKQISADIISTDTPDKLALKISTTKTLTGENAICFRTFFGDKLKRRMADLDSFNELILHARSADSDSTLIKIILVSKTGCAFSSKVQLTKEYKNYPIPFSSFVPDSMVLIPRPYPGFLPWRFKGNGAEKFDLKDSEVLEITIEPTEFEKPAGFEVAYVWIATNIKN
jgi:hypothetical protein